MQKSGEEKVKLILKRALFMYAPKVDNEDSFTSAIYGQGVLDETPFELVSNRPYYFFFNFTAEAETWTEILNMTEIVWVKSSNNKFRNFCRDNR